MSDRGVVGVVVSVVSIATTGIGSGVFVWVRTRIGGAWGSVFGAPDLGERKLISLKP